MKKEASLYYSILFLLAIPIFSSCKKDTIHSKELLVYVAGDYTSLENKIAVPFVHTPINVSGNTMVKIAVNATREIPADIEVKMAPDPSLVTTYNLKNNTSALMLPQSNYRVVNSSTLRIIAGSLVSDSMQIEILNPEQLKDPKGYLLPITISSFESKDKGAQISTNQNTVYVNVTYEFNNIAQTQAPLTGALMSRTPWSVTVSNTTAGALGPAMLDGSNTTAWRSSNSATAIKQVILNIGSMQTIKGFQVVPNYVAVAENATQMTVSSSNDNVNFTVQGIWRGSGPSATSSAASPDIKGINFVAPVQAQYFRFDITALVSGSRVGIGELNAVQ